MVDPLDQWDCVVVWEMQELHNTPYCGSPCPFLCVNFALWPVDNQWRAASTSSLPLCWDHWHQAPESLPFTTAQTCRRLKRLVIRPSPRDGPWPWPHRLQRSGARIACGPDWTPSEGVLGRKDAYSWIFWNYYRWIQSKYPEGLHAVQYRLVFLLQIQMSSCRLGDFHLHNTQSLYTYLQWWAKLQLQSYSVT